MTTSNGGIARRRFVRTAFASTLSVALLGSTAFADPGELEAPEG